jgi:phosphoglycerol transferase MdoB-like AlkP superfamily enzyme
MFYIIGLLLWRILFIWFNAVPDTLQPLIKSLWLDVSMICGVLIAGFFPWIMYLITGWRWLIHLNKWTHIILWTFVCIVEFASSLLFREWGSTLDARAISYLNHPNEAWASVKDFIPFWITFFGLIIFVSGLKGLIKLFSEWWPVRVHYFQSVVFILCVASLCVLGLRGGWQKLPIVPSDAFYSTDMKNNFAATNKVWYLLYSLSKKTEIKLSNPENEVDKFRQNYIVNTCQADSISGIWKSKNIVFIVMEGWSADMVSYLGGDETITPFFDSLSETSIRFTNAFSTGFRTDQGLMSILSGIPSIQSINMPNVIDKVKKYPSLTAVMKSTGRKTSFIYGGDLNFSNLYNYLTVMGFDTIIRDKDFKTTELITEWGVPDHIMVEKAVHVLDKNEGLFFSTILFLSSHSPFEVPWENKFSSQKDIPSKYKSSVKYCDESLEHFFKMAKTKSWFNNSIFVITSDHGSTHSGYASMEDHKRFRIPLIVYLPGSDSISENIDIPCNHFDLPKTTAALLDIDSESFNFGRNIFCHDQQRKGYWNIDVAAGCYGFDKSTISILGQPDTPNDEEGILFLDMIKLWFRDL